MMLWFQNKNGSTGSSGVKESKPSEVGLTRDKGDHLPFLNIHTLPH